MHRRLRTLAVLEGFNAVFLPAVLLTALGADRPLTAGIVAAAGALAVSLVAGSLYWSRRTRGPVSLPWCRAVEGLLGAAGLLAVVAAVLCVVDLGAGLRLVPVAGLGVAAFTAAEIVNYRFVQISAGGWRWWIRGTVRRPHLAIDLRRAAAA